MKLKDRVAIISGAAAGIGLATAKLFLEEGAKVAICDISAEKIAQAAQDLSSLGTVRPFVVNIADKQQVTEMVEAVAKEFGRIDILINNAGITKDAQFYKMTDEQFDAVINVNLRGNFLMTKAVVPYMMEQKYGKIVHCASVSAYNGNFGQSNYAASKAGLIGLTKSTARELAVRGVCCNAIAPGFIATDMTAHEVAADNPLIAQIPLGRMGTPEEIAELAAFLAGPASDYITGQVIQIDGGLAM